LRVLARQPVDEGMKDDGMKGLGEISWGAVLRNLDPPGPSAEGSALASAPNGVDPVWEGLRLYPRLVCIRWGPLRPQELCEGTT
jgi:hypothetical protein